MAKTVLSPQSWTGVQGASKGWADVATRDRKLDGLRNGLAFA